MNTIIASVPMISARARTRFLNAAGLNWPRAGSSAAFDQRRPTVLARWNVAVAGTLQGVHQYQSERRLVRANHRVERRVDSIQARDRIPPCRATVDLLVNAPPLTIANGGNYLAIQSSGGSSTISIDRDGTGGD